MAVEGSQTLKPWLSIWTKPRQTIRWIISTQPRRFVGLLAALAGISEALDKASAKGLADRISVVAVIFLALLIGPIAGVISLYLGGFLLSWTGRWLEGQGEHVNIRAALAWSGIPLIASLPLWIPQLAIFGSGVFASEPSAFDTSVARTVTFVGLGLVDIGLGIWSLVLLTKCLSEVQGFSSWKALGNLLLAALLVAVPVFLMILVIARAIS